MAESSPWRPTGPIAASFIGMVRRIGFNGRRRGVHAGAGRLTAPMPGRVVKIAVTAGQSVGQNQPLITLEAMKMEHVIEAPHPGVVAEIHVQVGEQVPSGAQLLTLGTVPPS